MIKHADNARYPLLTAEERVNRIISDMLAAKQAFTAEQRNGLDISANTLIVNLAIEPETALISCRCLSGTAACRKPEKVFGAGGTATREINYTLAA